MTSLQHALARLKKAASPAMSRLAFAVASSILLVVVGLRATRAGNEHRAALRDVRDRGEAYREWRRLYKEPLPAETTFWRRVRMEVQDLGIGGDERLAITQSVSRAAEAAGLRDVRVMIGGPDTTGTEERLSTEGVRLTPASFGLLLDGRGSMQGVVDLLGHLPPSVAVTGVRLLRQDGRARHRVMLGVYEVSTVNEPSSFSTSAQRGNSGARRGGRDGG